MLLSFFTGYPKEWEALKASDARRDVPYDPALITALTHQHRELVMLLVKASSAAEQCYYAEATESLRQFKANLDAHFKRETDQLLPYLSSHLWGEGSDQLLREMHANGTLIERKLRRFLDSYIDRPVDNTSLYDFLIEIERACEEFSQDVEREETAFYTLYMTPEAY